MKKLGIALVLMLLLVAAASAPASAAYTSVAPDESSSVPISVSGQVIDAFNDEGKLMLSGAAVSYLKICDRDKFQPWNSFVMIQGYINGYSDGYHGYEFSSPKLTLTDVLKAWRGNEVCGWLATRFFAYSAGFSDGQKHSQPVFPIPDLPDLTPFYSDGQEYNQFVFPIPVLHDVWW